MLRSYKFGFVFLPACELNTHKNTRTSTETHTHAHAHRETNKQPQTHKQTHETKTMYESKGEALEK